MKNNAQRNTIRNAKSSVNSTIILHLMLRDSYLAGVPIYSSNAKVCAYPLSASYRQVDLVFCESIGNALSSYQVSLACSFLLRSMDVFVVLSLVLGVPTALFIAYLILSTCLGGRFRARVSGAYTHVKQGSSFSYGRTYVQGLGSTINQGGWEQIEMETMLEPRQADEGY